MIRAAVAADLPAILGFWNPLIRDTLVTFSSAQKSLADMQKMLDDKAAEGRAFLVAEAAGAVVGFCSYGQFRAGNGYAHTMEHTIILDPVAHGRGLGRALLTGIEADARTKGAHSILAGVSGGNPESRAFHAAMGYGDPIIVPQAGWKFGRWWDLWLMQKILS
ncbi:GNAT family N-acetyltransferase [Rhodobacter ferrooxidans]|uniref:GCN5-related N-acetyltransferase n=1 Tax=Rhodobacter ferrooxidans TaxID=371731 RepID=C8S1F4_9RHOB|nr:GNAT family N-acetyltransferase [Rhodobacter sp. SW2]EEW25127.1 GCN5-related N-acetyltransferase [Rhodobacter sp. SW2]